MQKFIHWSSPSVVSIILRSTTMAIRIVFDVSFHETMWATSCSHRPSFVYRPSSNILFLDPPPQLPSARATFAALKERLQPLLGNMPANKQKFRLEDGTFPKNEQTMAVLNLKAGTVVELMPKERTKKAKKGE
jgi:hypothetical protein